MIPHSGSRLAVIIVLLVLQSLIFIFELLIFTRRIRRKPWYRPLRQLIGPVSIASLVAILASITFANASRNKDDPAEQCSASVDGDIAGQGAQIAVWAQVGVLLVISILGSFHTSTTGAKEVGAGLVLTHVSLSIALLTQMRLGTLSSADGIVGSMILDAQNIGLSVQLAAKETLASRWQVKVVVLTQTFGLIVIPVLVSNFSHGVFASNDCRCLTVFWWAWLSSCGSTTVREMPVFWTYYACRVVGFSQTSFHSLYNTSKFDKAEKSEKAVANNGDEASEMDAVDHHLDAVPLRGTQEHGDAADNNYPDQAQNDTQERRTNRGRHGRRGIRLRRATHLHRRQNGHVVSFGECPATVTLMYGVYAAFSLTSMATVQTTVAEFNLKPPSPIDSVGQIVSLVVAAATLGRAAWLFFILFRSEKRRGKWNFMWPFRWHVNRDHLRALVVGDYVFCSPPREEFIHIPLGACLTEPFDPASQFGVILPASEAVHEICDTNTTSVVSNETSGVMPIIGSYKTVHKEWLKTDSLKTSSFDPSSSSLSPHVARWLQDQLLLAGGEQARSLYMVTGVKIAKNLAIHRYISENSRVSEDKTLFASPGEVLLAYRLHMLRWSRRERTFVFGGVYRPEEDW